MRQNLLTFALTLVLAAMATAQTPVGGGFTYQGRLDFSGAPVNDTYDFEFTLWDADAGGNMIGSMLAVDAVAVVDGLITVELDFGVMAFNGDARWLEIALRESAGGGAFTALSPRQPLTATPYALQTRGMVVGESGSVVIHPTINDAIGSNATVSGGSGNVVRQTFGTIGGGEGNVIDDPGSWGTIGGGTANRITGFGSQGNGALVATIGGGDSNEAGDFCATVAGGQRNKAIAVRSTVGGGFDNVASGINSVVAGGGGFSSGSLGNTASGTNSTVPGGASNVAAGDHSFAAGRRAKANHHGAWVWADHTAADFASTAEDQFLIRATGGVGIGTNTPSTELDVDGTVTAGAFVGDGSGLTNLPVMAGVWTESGNDVYYTAGNVGVGTDTPGAALDVIGDIHANGSVFVLGTPQLDQSSESLDAHAIVFGLWQSFTAGLSGPLKTVSIRLDATGTATSATLTVYEGVGTEGTVVSQGEVSLPTGVTAWVDLPVVAMPFVQAGQQYTFEVAANDTIYIGNGRANPYPDGQSNLHPNDATFRTYVALGGTVTAGAFVGDGSGLTNLPVGGVWETNAPNIHYSNGFVGFGTDTPTAPLHVLGGNQTPVAHLRVEVDDTAPHGAFFSLDARAIDGGREYLIFSTGGSADEGRGKLVFKNQTNNKTAITIDPSGDVGLGTVAPTNPLSVAGNADFTGSVGIGTNNPTRGKVDIEGFVSRALGLHAFLGRSGIVGISAGSSPANYSLYASHRIAASSFNAHSDARIKSIVGLSDNNADLNTLMAIEVTDYTMLDKVTNGDQPYKKVIGQQLRDVFPQAVTLSADVVPDIYQPASVEDGWIALATDLEVGDRVRLITDDGASVHEVLEVRADRFRIAKSLEGRIFVYGREVDDFHNVDYEAISMLNVSATQALHRRIEQLQLLQEEKNAEVAALKTVNETLGQRLERLEALVQQTGTR